MAPPAGANPAAWGTAHRKGEAPPASNRTKICLAAMFALTAGYADAICLVRYKVFATMMTGNLLMTGLSLVDPRWVKLSGMTRWTFPLFCLSIIATKMFGVGLREEAERLHPYGTTILCPFLVMLFVAIEVVNYATPEPLYPEHFGVLFLAPLFGMVNSVSIHGILGVPTTMATGHMQNLVYASHDYWAHGKPFWNMRIAIHLTVIFFLFLGAMLGAFGSIMAEGHKCQKLLLSPCLLLVGLTIVAEDHFSTPEDDEKDEEAALNGGIRLNSARWLWGMGSARIPHPW